MDHFNTPDEIRATRGDLIEFKRRKFRFFPYYHFAVCTCDSNADWQVNVPINRNAGDGYLRVTVGVDVLDEDSSKFKIREKTIRELCNYQRGCRVNNLEEAATEKGLEPFNPDVIVRRARDRFNEELIENYHLLTDNCEHFATWCRYGTKFSCQMNLLILEPFIYVSRWRARRQTDHPNDMIIESVRQNEERN